MKFVCSLSFLACLMAAQPALCQDRTDAAPSDPFSLQRYVSASAGFASVGANTGTFAAEYGDRVTRNSLAYANLSYFDNLMTDEMRDHLAAAASSITAITWVNRSFSGRDRGIAFTAGGKYQPGTRVRPYVGGGAGAIWIKRTVTERTLGDVSLQLAPLAWYGDGLVSTGSTDATRPLGEVVGGVGFVTRNMYIDVGYRFRRVFRTATDVDLSQVAVGIGAKW